MVLHHYLTILAKERLLATLPSLTPLRMTPQAETANLLKEFADVVPEELQTYIFVGCYLFIMCVFMSYAYTFMINIIYVNYIKYNTEDAQKLHSRFITYKAMTHGTSLVTPKTCRMNHKKIYNCIA